MPRALISSLLLLTSLPACVTLGRHEELEERVMTLERFREETRQNLERDVQRLEHLNDRIKEATEALRKNGASLGAKLDAQAEDLRGIHGRLEELEHLTQRMSSQVEIMRKFLDERFGLTVEVLPKDIPTDPDKMLEYGQERFKAGQYDLARAVFKSFIQKFPQHARVPTAMLMVGETYRMQRQFDQALQTYRKTFEEFPKSTEAPTALLHAGYCLRDKGQCREAQQMFRYLAQSFPKSPEAAEAKQLAKTKCP